MNKYKFNFNPKREKKEPRKKKRRKRHKNNKGKKNSRGYDLFMSLLSYCTRVCKQARQMSRFIKWKIMRVFVYSVKYSWKFPTTLVKHITCRQPRSRIRFDVCFWLVMCSEQPQKGKSFASLRTHVLAICIHCLCSGDSVTTKSGYVPIFLTAKCLNFVFTFI